MRGNDTTFWWTSASHLSSNMQSQAAKRDIGDYIVQRPLLIPMHPQLPIHTPMVDCHVSANNNVDTIIHEICTCHFW